MAGSATSISNCRLRNRLCHKVQRRESISDQARNGGAAAMGSRFSGKNPLNTTSAHCIKSAVIKPDGRPPAGRRIFGMGEFRKCKSSRSTARKAINAIESLVSAISRIGDKMKSPTEQARKKRKKMKRNKHRPGINEKKKACISKINKKRLNTNRLS